MYAELTVYEDGSYLVHTRASGRYRGFGRFERAYLQARRELARKIQTIRRENK